MAFPLTVTQTLSTTASPAAVWRAFEAVDQWPTVMPALAAARLEPQGAVAAGSLIRTRAVSGSNTADRDYRVVAAEAPHRLVLAVDDETYRAVTTYVITASDDGGSDITATGTLDAVGLAQSVRFLLWRARIAPILTTNTRERAQHLIDLAERMAAAG